MSGVSAGCGSDCMYVCVMSHLDGDLIERVCDVSAGCGSECVMFQLAVDLSV